MNFNKRTMSTTIRDHAKIKHVLESTLRDLPKVVKVIREKIEDQLYKICLQHSFEKNGNIKAMLNIGIFWYLKHEISKCALDLITTNAVEVNATILLPQCTGVFSKTLNLPCRH